MQLKNQSQLSDVSVVMAAVLQLKDKVAIVTGGSSGIGKACTDVFGKILLYHETIFLLCL